MSQSDATDDTTQAEQTPFTDDGDLLDNAELVIQTTSLDEVEYDSDAISDRLIDAGVCSASLWARYPGTGFELPLWINSPASAWLSMSQDTYTGEDADPVSDTFIDAVAAMVDDTAGEWGSIPDEIQDNLSEVEWMLVVGINRALIEMEPVEPMMITEWCVDRSEYGSTQSD